MLLLLYILICWPAKNNPIITALYCYNRASISCDTSPLWILSFQVLFRDLSRSTYEKGDDETLPEMRDEGNATH